MSVIPALRNIPAASVLAGTASAGSVSPAPATDLVIEQLDEFAINSYSPTYCSGADYIFAAVPVAA
jgi:hypothetical protein